MITISDINDIRESSCDVNGTSEICKKILSKSNVDNLYLTIYQRLGNINAINDYQHHINKYKTNRKKYILVFIVVITGDTCNSILKIVER